MSTKTHKDIFVRIQDLTAEGQQTASDTVFMPGCFKGELSHIPVTSGGELRPESIIGDADVTVGELGVFADIKLNSDFTTIYNGIEFYPCPTMRINEAEVKNGVRIINSANIIAVDLSIMGSINPVIKPFKLEEIPEYIPSIKKEDMTLVTRAHWKPAEDAKLQPYLANIPDEVLSQLCIEMNRTKGAIKHRLGELKKVALKKVTADPANNNLQTKKSNSTTGIKECSITRPIYNMLIESGAESKQVFKIGGVYHAFTIID